MQYEKATRKRYSPQFKLQVAMEALQEKEPLSDLAQRHSIHPTQITQWKKQLKEKLKDFFTTGRPRNSLKFYFGVLEYISPFLFYEFIIFLKIY